MNKNTVGTTVAEIQNVSIEKALEVYFHHRLDALPRMTYDTQHYHRLESDMLVVALAERVKEYIDLEWGGVKLDSVYWIDHQWPSLRKLAKKHRRATFEARVLMGTAIKLHIGGIPSDASYQDIAAGLKLRHPYELSAPSIDNICRGFAFVIVSPDVAETLLTNQPPKTIRGLPVAIRTAWAKR